MDSFEIMKDFEEWFENNYAKLSIQCSEEGFCEDSPDFDMDAWAFRKFEDTFTNEEIIVNALAQDLRSEIDKKILKRVILQIGEIKC